VGLVLTGTILDCAVPLTIKYSDVNDLKQIHCEPAVPLRLFSDALLLSIVIIPWILRKSSTVRRKGVYYRSSDSGVTALDK
jgi:hypothetical protein